MFRISIGIIWINAALIGCVNGQLPMLNKNPWLGYLAVHIGNRFDFGVTTERHVSINAMDRKKQRLSEEHAVNVIFNFEEMMPNGKVNLHPLEEDSLVSNTSPSRKLVKTGFRGKTAAEAANEFDRRGGVKLSEL